MQFSRRKFLQTSSLATTASALFGFAPFIPSKEKDSPKPKRVNPWIELSKEAYLKNAAVISQMAGGNQVLAVLKNNAYGLGDVEVGKVLDKSPHIAGIALVKEERALALRQAGVKKPILLMADFDEALGNELAQAQITLAIHSHDSFKKVKQLANRAKFPVKVEMYTDTGLGRMGIPYYGAGELAQKVANERQLNIVGTFTTLTTPKDFAKEQLQRFDRLIQEMKQHGIRPGNCHAAPSYSMLDIPASHLDLVRPGILLHGSFPTVLSKASEDYTLHPTFRLKARVIRIEKLRKGDSVGFSRFYTAQKEEWIATIPIGWADGYDSGAENGAKVLVGDRLYPVINVNASHCNLLLNREDDIKVGEVATLIGPDRPEITPSGFAKLTNGHTYLQIQYKESIPKYVQDTFE